jgi:hypothetical protein
VSKELAAWAANAPFYPISLREELGSDSPGTMKIRQEINLLCPIEKRE